MRLQTLELKGVLAFHDKVVIDFTALPSGLLAITGGNGAGKTALIDSCVVHVGRMFPSREGNIVEFATESDSVIETRYDMGLSGVLRARLNLDGPRRNGDAVLEQHIDGQVITLNPKADYRTFDEQVGRFFPSRTTLLASAFASQNRNGSFVTLDKKGRRDLFADLLGLGHYEGIAMTAGAAVKLIADARMALADRRGILSLDLPPDIIASLDAEANRLQRVAGDAQVRQRELERTLSDLEDQIALCADADGAYAVAYAVASLRARSLEAQITARQRETTTLTQALTRLDIDLKVQVGELAFQRDGEIQKIDTTIANNLGLADRAEEIADAVTRIGALTTQIDALEGLAHQRQAEVDDQQQALQKIDPLLAQLDRQHEQLARTRAEVAQLETVPCGGQGDFAACRFLTKAADAARHIPALESDIAALEPKKGERQSVYQALTAARTALADLRARIAAAKGEWQQTEKIAALAQILAASEARVEELRRQRNYIQTSTDAQISSANDRATSDRQRLQAHLDEVEDILTGLVTDCASATSDLADLAAGNDRVTDLRRYRATAQAEFNEIQRTLGTVHAETAALSRRRTDLLAKMAQRSALSGRIAELDAEMAEFQMIARMCGRDGLPTLEIDAAGPTVSAYANDILSVVMPRFTVELVTQEARLSKSKDGSTFKEVFDLKVIDNEQGGERAVSDLSGGQQVIVDEALKSALSIHANSRNIAPIETCWRDETTGALHPETAPLYVQMLRRAHQLGKTYQTIFVTHNPEAAALADCQLYVANGTVEVRYPPYAA